MQTCSLLRIRVLVLGYVTVRCLILLSSFLSISFFFHLSLSPPTHHSLTHSCYFGARVVLRRCGNGENVEQCICVQPEGPVCEHKLSGKSSTIKETDMWSFNNRSNGFVKQKSGITLIRPIL